MTGLSAGGAMTLAMLAIYPDVFAAGASHCRSSLWHRNERSGSAARYVSRSAKILPRTGRSSEGGVTK